MTAERDQIVRTRLCALVADDTRLRARLGLDLEPQHSAESRRHGTPLRRILECKRRLWRVLQRQPETFNQVDEKNHAEQFHHDRSPTRLGSDSPTMMTRSLRSTVPSLRILSCSRINPYSNASGRGGQPDTYTSTGTILSTPCSTLYVGNGPPAFEQLPIEMTHLGSGIWSYR